ncbi:AP-3 complex subunit delta [Candida viswanathii]|uniref:AP-3 complex subunit delta n=1 Tax=Candida viswanathii TaxID=5486 RepID=A0A367XVS7_9ASCO|nr:AP-3 complex subunit delta [Candida viswanathii]
MSSFQLQNSEVLARLKPFGILFEKSLSDLIKGIRAHSKESPESLVSFLDVAIQECRNELSTTDLETKAIAILKLAYLEMYGFDMSWCNFQILEVMSSSKFQQKRIGYLAAIQSFKNEQDLLILATNQFKKDLNSHNHVDIGLALSGIATIVTPNLAKDINDDVLMKLNHSKPYVRKKAILAMYKIFLQYPESLRLNFNRVIEKLDDSDVAVVSATVNIICEISKKNPNIFINYLPKFFAILEDTKNNWLIIRILKLFQSLSKVEPRMKKKILPSIIDLMVKTQASSLIYECINCIVNGQMLSHESYKDQETAKLCVNQLMNFFKTRDSNLKFVGLIALINILKIFPVFMSDVEGVSAVVLDCLNDEDLIIKRKALEVSNYLVDEDNITDVVKTMLLQLVPSDTIIDDSLKVEVTLKILQIASQDNYANIPNFRWYVAVLNDIVNLTLLPVAASGSTGTISPAVANEIAVALGNEFKNLATKVPSIRAYLLKKVVIELVQDLRIMDSSSLILRDAYWILGEYVDELKSISQGDDDDEKEDDEEAGSVQDLDEKLKTFNTLVNHKIDEELGLTVNSHFPISAQLVTLPYESVITVLIQALVKLYNGIAIDYVRHFSANEQLPVVKYNELCYHLYRLIGFLSNFESHHNYEVQERALSWLEFLKLVLEAMTDNNFEEVVKLANADLEYYKHLKVEHTAKDDSDSESEEDEEEEEEEEEGEEEESEEDEYENLVSSDDEQESRPVHMIEDEYNPFAENEEAQLEEQPVEAEEQTEYDPGFKKLPVLLSHILPSFFSAYKLNPVSKNAQRNIAIPKDLDLETQIRSPEFKLVQYDTDGSDTYDLFLSDEEQENQEPLIQLTSDEQKESKRERLERIKDDPYYIEDSVRPKKKTKSKKKGSTSVSPDTQSDIISVSTTETKQKSSRKAPKLKKEKVLILDEETVAGGSNNGVPLVSSTVKPKKKSGKKNVLKIDSSNLDNFDLNVNDTETPGNNDQEYEIDLEALRERLNQASLEEPPEKKKKKKSKKKPEDTNGAEPGVMKPKKTKKKKAVILE